MVVYGGLVLFAGFQIITAQIPPGPPPPPPECRGPPRGVTKPFDCCQIPHFFDPKEFEECGFKKPEEGQQQPGPPPPPDCNKQLCLLQKYDMVDGEEINHEKVGAFLDSNAEKYPEFKDAIEKAKEKCVGKEIGGPPHVCPANRMVFCISSTLFGECPTWQDTEECTILKDHMDNCKKYWPQ